MKKIGVLLTLTLLLAASCKQGEETAASGGKAATGTAAATATGTEVGSRLPDYSALWLDGAKFDLATRRENVVLLNVWATWCGPCRFEIPELQALHDRFKAQKFEVIGVSVDESGPEPVKQFVTDHKMTYPIVLDAEGKLANVLQTSVLPTTVLLDRNGKIVWKRLGMIEKNDQELVKAIEAAL
ncbi:MAG TPA: TlpA disulfide reductase family protein [Thermoanaerobaculia bacterium]|nr:TlpA disulfide reductase family protein [Thermoanaerobaculia bacterium]